GVGSHAGLPRWCDKGSEVTAATGGGESVVTRQGKRLDADHRQPGAIRGFQRALQQGRNRQARVTQAQIIRLGQRFTVAPLQAVKSGGEQRFGASVAVAGRGVDRLHAAPQCTGDPQPEQQHGKLAGMTPIVGEQRGKGGQHQRPGSAEGSDSSRPWVRRRQRSSGAATWGLWVTISKALPASRTRSSSSASTSPAVASSRLPVGSSASSNAGRG